MGAQPVIRYLRTCFWLLVPVLGFNLLFAQALPPAFQPASFSRDIPTSISVLENVLRGLLIVFLLLMPLKRLGTRRFVPGVVLYSIGVGLYFAAWAALILSPTGAWSTTALGFTAPAWTPVFWLGGIAWLSEERLFVPIRFYRRWIFVGVCVAFLLFHTAHAALVFSRQG